jgi:prepilin-type N-terminal cleavage/methylation domain-containing protein
MYRSNRAFTLIELLVVIAIIAILAAILFPVFAQAKLAAKKTVALSNAKQIATANMIYMGDYDDALIKEFYGFPSDCSSWPSDGASYYGWRHIMSPYVAKSSGLLQDPTNPFMGTNYWVDEYTDTAGKKYNYPTNFAVNNDVIGFANGRCAGPWTPEGLDSINQLDEPAATILMVPSRSKWNDLKPSFLSTIEGKPDWCITPLGGSAATCPAGTNGPIHAVGKQVAWIWADGHAKTKPALATLDVANPDRDDWASKYATNPRTNAKWTQADRRDVANTAWGEYK